MSSSAIRSKDWYERTLLKLGREYTRDEVVTGLMETISKLHVEIGKLVSEIHELEDLNKKLNHKFSNRQKLNKKSVALRVLNDHISKVEKELHEARQDRDKYYNWYLCRPRPEERQMAQGIGNWATTFQECGCTQIAKHRGQLKSICPVHDTKNNSKFRLSRKMAVGFIINGLNDEEE